MTPLQLIEKIKATPEQISFTEVIDTIEQHYNYLPGTFSNGLGEDKLINTAGSNEGSCKIFAFALLHQLSPQETLSCFGQYYYTDVLQNPHADDHGNIRNFIKHGWDGIAFRSEVLSLKTDL